MAQPFKAFLTKLADDTAFRANFFLDPDSFVSQVEAQEETEDKLPRRQVDMILRGNVNEIQHELKKEAKQAGDDGTGPGTAIAMVTIDN